MASNLAVSQHALGQAMLADRIALKAALVYARHKDKIPRPDEKDFTEKCRIYVAQQNGALCQVAGLCGSAAASPSPIFTSYLAQKTSDTSHSVVLDFYVP